MTYKDWLTIFLPIFFNGIILFFVQQWFLSLMEKKNKKISHLKYVYTQFFILLKKLYALMTEMKKVNSEYSAEHLELSEAWNPISKCIDEITVLINTNPKAFKKNNCDFDNCINAWNEMLIPLRRSKEENNNILSLEDSIKFVELWDKFKITVNVCLEKCEKEILKNI